MNKVDINAPVIVRVKLRRGQYTGHMNKWLCTIFGEKREVTMQEVEWCCVTLESAAHSFRIEEIESFTITGQYS